MKRTSIALATAFTLSCTAVSLPEAEEKMEIGLVETNNEVENTFSSNYDKGKEIWLTGLKIQEERLEQERLEAERLAREEAERIEQERLRAIEEENRIANVHVNLDNVLEVSNITVDELIAVFDFYDYSKSMKELAWIFVEAERTYGINAFILSSIASWESNYGRSSRARCDNNYLGWGVTSPSAEGINASSPYENIMGAAKFLRSDYLTEGGLYYNGLSTWGISRNYCRDEYGNPSEAWLEGINSISKNYEWIYGYLFRNN